MHKNYRKFHQKQKWLYTNDNNFPIFRSTRSTHTHTHRDTHIPGNNKNKHYKIMNKNFALSFVVAPYFFAYFSRPLSSPIKTFTSMKSSMKKKEYFTHSPMERWPTFVVFHLFAYEQCICSQTKIRKWNEF